MKKLTLILSSILAVQVLLTILLFTYKSDSGAFQSNQTWLDLTPGAFDAISITQKDKPSLTLKKDKEQWLLPGYFNVPVSKEKFDDFSGKLLSLKTGWPVASTEEAAERFQVNKEKYERLIVFQKDGKAVKTLYLGTSPGFKKIHARVDGQNDILAIDFSAFEASVTPEDWMKQDLIKIDLNQLSQIKSKDFSLVKADKDWVVEGLQANQTNNVAEIKALVDKLAALTYSGILGLEDKPEYHLKDAELSFILKTGSEETQYQFGKQEGKDDAVLKLSSQPYYFKVSKGVVDALKAFNLQKLVLAKPLENAEPSKDKQPEIAPEKPKK